MKNMSKVKALCILSVLGFVPAAAFAATATVGAIGTPVYSGTGCTSANSSMTVSPDHKALSFIFDNYQASAGVISGVHKANDSETCNIQIPITLPSGVKVSIKTAQYRGFNALPAGGSALFSARLFFNDAMGYAKSSAPVYQSFSGGTSGSNDTFNVETVPTAASTLYSGCGGQTTLTLTSRMYVQTNSNFDSAQSNVDSVDGNISPEFAANLAFEPCTQAALPTEVGPGAGRGAIAVRSSGTITPAPVIKPVVPKFSATPSASVIRAFLR